MKQWSFYKLDTGEFTTGNVSAPDHATVAFAIANAPKGCGVLEGVYNPNTHKYDVQAQRVVEWRPPSPGDDFEWSDAKQRYVQTLATSKKFDALAKIAKLEAKQPRAIREHALGHPGAAERLQQLDADIVALRLTISGKSPGTAGTESTA